MKSLFLLFALSLFSLSFNGSYEPINKVLDNEVFIAPDSSIVFRTISQSEFKVTTQLLDQRIAEGQKMIAQKEKELAFLKAQVEDYKIMRGKVEVKEKELNRMRKKPLKK